MRCVAVNKKHSLAVADLLHEPLHVPWVLRQQAAAMAADSNGVRNRGQRRTECLVKCVTAHVECDAARLIRSVIRDRFQRQMQQYLFALVVRCFGE